MTLHLPALLLIARAASNAPAPGWHAALSIGAEAQGWVLILGWGWDDRMPLRPWPVRRQTGTSVTWAWAGFFCAWMGDT